MKIELPDYDTGLRRCKSNHCPACASQMIEGQEVEIGKGAAAQDMCCLDCDTEWREVYTMIDFTFYNLSGVQ